MDMEPIAFRSRAQVPNAESVPHGRRSMEVGPPLVGNGQVVHGFHPGRLPQVLDRRDKALSARVEQVFGLPTVVRLTPGHRFLVLFRGVARSLGEGDEPCCAISFCIGYMGVDMTDMTRGNTGIGSGSGVQVGHFRSTMPENTRSSSCLSLSHLRLTIGMPMAQRPQPRKGTIRSWILAK